MVKRRLKVFSGTVLSVLMSSAMLFTAVPDMVYADSTGWRDENGTQYWYEDGVKQGTQGRGKEIYDQSSDAWYWLDAVQGGAPAKSKDVYQESTAGQWGGVLNKDGSRSGKWVRYDADGHMVKGWDYTSSGDYYFDVTYGTMAKGYATIDDIEYYFNPSTGILEDVIVGNVEGYTGWKCIDGNYYWYEDGIRQGYSLDNSYRGKEVYDPGSDAWYWLDNVDGGRKAVSKDVYQESLADDKGTIGKWVRYDSEGHMIKGWSSDGKFYFDLVYGTMYKGSHVIDGVEYFFNETTGVLESGQNNVDIPDETPDETPDKTPDETPDETPDVDDTFNEDSVHNRLLALAAEYPEGRSLTNSNYTYVWKNKLGYSKYTGKGCMGFAFMASDAAFGEDTPVYKTYDLSKVKTGDILRINNNTHSVVVLDVYSDRVIICEGNYNSSVHWGRTLLFSDIQFNYILTRYPQDGTQSKYINRVYDDNAMDDSDNADSDDNYDADDDNDAVDGDYIKEMAIESLKLQNEYRAAAGVEALEWNEELYQQIMVRGPEIAEYFSHTRPDGTRCFTVVKVPYSTCGENIAAGYMTAADVTDGWYNSTGHRNNMLNSRYTSAAVVCYYSPDSAYGCYWVTMFVG